MVMCGQVWKLYKKPYIRYGYLLVTYQLPVGYVMILWLIFKTLNFPKNTNLEKYFTQGYNSLVWC